MKPLRRAVSTLLLVSASVQAMIVGNVAACFLSHFSDSRPTASGVARSIQFLIGGAMGTVLEILHTRTLTTGSAVLAAGSGASPRR